MFRAARTDANQTEITKALRKIGCSVQLLHSVGRGCPDMLVGYKGGNYLLEIKDGEKPESQRKLTPEQTIWHFDWKGQVAVVNNVQEAIDTIKRLSGIV
jgi:hypothetical protein